jgi:hypothetical protein
MTKGRPVRASWRVTPDKYERPREFDDDVKALRYSEETCGRYELLVGLLNPDDARLDLDCTPLESGDELPRGSVVVDRSSTSSEAASRPGATYPGLAGIDVLEGAK